MNDLDRMKATMSGSWQKSAEVQANRLDTAFDEFQKELNRTPIEVLYYIIHWNNGISGVAVDPVAALARREAERRGKPYTDEISDVIAELFM